MSKPTEIIVSAARGFNHPYEDYSNLKPFISMKVELEEGDDPEKVTKEYQAKVESLVEDHKQNMLESLRRLYEMGRYEKQVACLENQIKRSQHDLENLRKQQTTLLPE